MTSRVEPADTEQHAFVSVVVPMRNEYDHIEPCIESFLSQTYPSGRFEVIIVDGESTDGSTEKVEAYLDQNANLRLVNNPGRIRASGLNQGIRSACGDIIVIMDFHVLYPPDYIEKCVRLLENNIADNVGGSIITRPGANTMVAKGIAALLQHRFGVGGSQFRISKESGYVDTVPFGAMRIDLFERVGLFDETLVRTEDNEFNSRIIKSGGRIFMSSDIQSEYFSRPTVRSLLRQAYGSGKSHVSTLHAGSHAFKLKYYVPMLFVLAMALGLFGFVWTPLLALLLLTGLPYLVLNLLASIDIARRQGWYYLGVLPVLFLVYHVSYGLGTLAGFAGMLRRPAVRQLSIP